MSKWLKKDAYEMFANEKTKEAEQIKETPGGGFYKKWNNPTMGTVEKAKEYKVRLLPDPVKGFYKKYFYHGFTSGESFNYVLCEKTFGMDKYCAWCEATKILYQGNESDKKKAGEYKRKERFVSNIYVVEDPRDAEVKDEKYKVNGTVRLYEFPATVESKIRNEVTDTDNGYGMGIFDPESGYDFILKIKAKPKDKSGKEWPDYGDTMFARKATPLGDEETLDKLMEARYDLDAYIKSLRKTNDEQEQLLKAEMLWDDVGASFTKNMGKTVMPSVNVNVDDDDPPFEAEKKSVSTTKAATKTPVVEKEDDADDTDALLAELQDL